MSYIICATDFKEASLNAIRYACGLSRQKNVPLSIIHVESLTKKIWSGFASSNSQSEVLVQELVTKMHAYFPDVEIAGSVISGNLFEAIDAYIHKNGEPLMVVVGNRYQKDHQAFMDSNMMHLFRQLRAPLLAVPTGAEFATPKKLCLLFDNKIEGAETALKQARDLVIHLNMELHIVVGWDDGFSRDNQPELNAAAEHILGDRQTKHHFVEKHHLNEDLISFAEKSRMDWVAVIPRHHNAIEELVHKSHSQYMVNHAHVPVLALHETQH